MFSKERTHADEAGIELDAASERFHQTYEIALARPRMLTIPSVLDLNQIWTAFDSTTIPEVTNPAWIYMAWNVAASQRSDPIATIWAFPAPSNSREREYWLYSRPYSAHKLAYCLRRV